MKKAFAVLIPALLLFGCITTSVTPLSGRSYPPVNESEVVIYLQEDDIPRSFEKIAVIYARGDYSLTDEAHMIKKVRRKAAKLGANGVLLHEIKEPSTGAKVAKAILHTEANRKGEMIAIYVTPPDARGATADN